MIRPILTEISIFLIPFAVYALFLLATRSSPLVRTAMKLPMNGRIHVGRLMRLSARAARERFHDGNSMGVPFA